MLGYVNITRKYLSQIFNHFELVSKAKNCKRMLKITSLLTRVAFCMTLCILVIEIATGLN